MKKKQISILSAWVLAVISTVVGASEDIRIRVVAPFPTMVDNEYPMFLMRIENHSKGELPMKVHDPQGYRQFGLIKANQKVEDAELQWVPWGGIVNESDSKLLPGQALETFPIVEKPPVSGDYIFLLATGPQRIVASNIIKLELLPRVDYSAWPVLHRGSYNRSANIQRSIISGEVGAERALFIRIGPPDTLLSRLCNLPGDEVPEFVVNKEKSQITLNFPTPDNTIYYSSSLGWCKNKPWESSDARLYLNKPIPIEDESPMDFPKELFSNSSDSTAMASESNASSANSPQPSSSPKDKPVSSLALYGWLAAGLSVIGLGFYLWKNRSAQR